MWGVTRQLLVYIDFDSRKKILWKQPVWFSTFFNVAFMFSIQFFLIDFSNFVRHPELWLFSLQQHAIQ